MGFELDEKSGNTKKSKIEELEERIRELEEKTGEDSSTTFNEKENDSNKISKQISRRGFLKKVGVGTLALGAGSLIPNGLALDIKDSNGLKVFQNNNKYLDVSSNSVNITNTQLQEQGNRVATRNWANNNTINSVDAEPGEIIMANESGNFTAVKLPSTIETESFSPGEVRTVDVSEYPYQVGFVLQSASGSDGGNASNPGGSGGSGGSGKTIQGSIDLQPFDTLEFHIPNSTQGYTDGEQGGSGGYLSGDGGDGGGSAAILAVGSSSNQLLVEAGGGGGGGGASFDGNGGGNGGEGGYSSGTISGGSGAGGDNDGGMGEKGAISYQSEHVTITSETDNTESSGSGSLFS